MENLIFSAIAFLVLTILFYLININKYNIILNKKRKKSKKKKEKETIIMEIRYLTLKFNIPKEKLLTKANIIIISFLDAFIIAAVFLIILLVPLSLVWQLLIGFVLLFALIYAIFDIYGRYLVWREKKNERK